MTNKENIKIRRAVFLSVFPGAGHISIGLINFGIHLSTIFIGAALLCFWKWERFIDSFYGSDVGAWIASIFLILMLTGSAFISIYDILRVSRKKITEYQIKNLFQISLKRFKANRLALVSLYVIGLLYVFGILAPIIAPHDPNLIENVSVNRYLSPSMQHLFGTDEFGRDLFSRALYGARVSLSVGFLASLIAVTIGTFYGAAAGYFGKITDNILMRFVDVFISFPTMFLLIMLVGVFEVNVFAMVLILALTSWTGPARFIRGEILSLKKREFIESARAIGLPSYLILTRHLIPNALAPVFVSGALMVGGLIAAEAGLSFLGIGIRPPTATWGNMMTGSQGILMTAWWVAVFPGILLL